MSKEELLTDGQTDRTCLERMRASPLVCHALGRDETTLGATTQDVVEVALYTSSSNKLGINHSNGSIMLGKCDCCRVRPAKVTAEIDM
jgi:hypothetical protein